MKRAILILTAALCLVLSDRAYAQRALPGMRGLEIRGGMVDGFHSSDNRNELGYYFGVAMSTYAKNANKWVFGAEYLNRYYPYKDGRIPVAQFTAEGGYYYKFLADGSKTFFFSLGASALAGYETVNWGDKLLYDGSTIQNKDAFLYGGAITLEVEAYLTDRAILVLTGRERILWGTSTGHFHTQFGIGLKFMIN
ncbi:conjugal transfer protein TraO [Sunxiuqinia elliptica]|jgi:hypothetical protein|uniref:Conjugative transposon protein TraO n=1 Tax=Sunxiuqinia elliptica TaxID=655355 RepID=A0A4R6H930_9BACT|nr:conjugal transfer protein TraO [Sunxiuqinia elliptica]TDO04822.1 conjugative transposon protein TraO [Sunxiuqinia elliptica]TDO64370.1 conjugative transposon protein TraO [Sunxiuqinia elliptica]